MEGVPILEPLEHLVLVMALDSRLMEVMTAQGPIEHSVLQVARSDGPTAEISVLELLEHSVPDVAIDWGDRSFIEMTVSDPLEHLSLGETDGVHLDPLWMAPWDAGGTLDTESRPGITIWRAMLYLRSFRGLGRTSLVDLNAGELTTPVRMMGEDRGWILQDRIFRRVACRHCRQQIAIPRATNVRQIWVFPRRAVPRASSARYNWTFPGPVLPNARVARKD